MRLHFSHAAASLIYSLAFYCHPGMKEIEQDATIPSGNWPRFLCLESIKLYLMDHLMQTFDVTV